MQEAIIQHSPLIHELIDMSDESVNVGDAVELFESGMTGEVISIVEDNVEVEIRDEDGETHRVEVDGMLVMDTPLLQKAIAGMMAQPARCGVASKSGIDGSLVKALRMGFEKLLQGQVDYHPGSGTIVRDLIHPSLFPLVLDAPPTKKMTVDRWHRPYESSRFQWLPALFQVNENGETALNSDINNLDRSEHADFYDALAELFSAFVPLFESSLGYVDDVSLLEPSDEEHELPDVRSGSDTSTTLRKLRGKTLQVITKVIEYSLKDDESFEGVWHVEGMSHEHIVATGVYTLGRDENFEGGDLHFKRPFLKSEAGHIFWNIAQCRPASVDAFVNEGLLPIGKIETTEDKLFVFPNSHVHKLSKISVAGGHGEAKRQVIVFWLVDPDVPITSTTDVTPPNQTMTYEEACRVRLELMEERRLHKQTLNVRAVSLCEH